MEKLGKWALAVVLCVGCAKGAGSSAGNADVERDGGVVVTPPPPPTPPPSPPPAPPPPPPDDAGQPDSGTPDAGPKFGGPGPWPIDNVEYGLADGIQETPVVGVTTDELRADGQQNLWIATNFALYLLKPGETSFHRFDASDGLHLPGNPVQYCDTNLAGGDHACPIFGDASSPGIIEIVGGGPDEVFVGYQGQHNFGDPNDNSWSDPFRHTGKIDRVQLKPDGTLDVVRFDLVAGNKPQFWHNRTIYRMVYDHFIHKHELYVGTDHGIDKISPDLWFPPNPASPWDDYRYWMSDHLHPYACLDEQCTGDERHDNQRMGEWRGLALSPEGDLWVGGKWSAGKIFYTPVNTELKPDGTPNPAGTTGWFQRGGKAFTDPNTGRSYSFGFDFCGTSGVRNEWDGSAWVLRSCTPGSGGYPAFVPPNPGDPVSISAVAVTADGTSWWASGGFAGPAYGIASYDGRHFTHFDPISQAGMLESSVTDMVALPDGRLVLGSHSTGLTIWDPVAKSHVSIRAGNGIPDDHIVRLQVDTMVDPPALHVATGGGAAVLRILP